MKAVLWEKYGGPEGLRLGEIPKPEPGENDILIKVIAASVTAGDCEMRRLNLPLMLSFPMRVYAGLLRPKRIRVLGQEFAGIVEEVGSAVVSFQPGDHVFGTAGFGFGANAEYICLPETSNGVQGTMSLKPDQIPFDRASVVPTAGLEALHYMRMADVKQGDKVLIIGAGGSIGTFSIQLAKNYGAEVTGVDSTGKLELMRSLGADHVIDYTREDYLRSDQSYEVIIDVVGKRGVRERMRLLKPDGYYFLGYVSPANLLFKIWTGITKKKNLVIESSAQKKEDLITLKNLLESGHLQVPVDLVFPLEKTSEAHAYAESGQKKGNVAISVTQNFL